MGEQNIVWNTDMYVQRVQGQQTKWLRRFLRGQTGLDKVCYGGSVLAPGVSGGELSGFRAAGTFPSGGWLTKIPAPSRASERRQFEVGAQGLWRASADISITHQIQLLREEAKTGTYKVAPAAPLELGEYGLYLSRGEGMSPYVYDFSMPAGPLLSAKTVYIDNQSGGNGTVTRASDELGKWGRFQVVKDREQADLVFLFTGRKNQQHLAVIDTKTGGALWNDLPANQWGSMGSNSKTLIDAFHKTLSVWLHPNPW